MGVKEINFSTEPFLRLDKPNGLTINELITKLQDLQNRGYGNVPISIEKDYSENESDLLTSTYFGIKSCYLGFDWQQGMVILEKDKSNPLFTGNA